MADDSSVEAPASRRSRHPAAAAARSPGFVLRTLLIGMIGAAACGDDGAVEPLAACLEAAGATGAAVAIHGFAFAPDTLRIAAGTEVTWVNCEPAEVDPHTTTSDDGVWNSSMLYPGDTFARRFDDPGSFPYHCVPHPFMRAVVIVDGT